MSDELEEIQADVTNGQSSQVQSDQAFCSRMRAAIEATAGECCDWRCHEQIARGRCFKHGCAGRILPLVGAGEFGPIPTGCVAHAAPMGDEGNPVGSSYGRRLCCLSGDIQNSSSSRISSFTSSSLCNSRSRRSPCLFSFAEMGTSLVSRHHFIILTASSASASGEIDRSSLISSNLSKRSSATTSHSFLRSWRFVMRYAACTGAGERKLRLPAQRLALRCAEAAIDEPSLERKINAG